ncbi:hypothetical protein ACLOJK_020223 [Asimina triloba]
MTASSPLSPNFIFPISDRCRFQIRRKHRRPVIFVTDPNPEKLGSKLVPTIIFRDAIFTVDHQASVHDSLRPIIMASDRTTSTPLSSADSASVQSRMTHLNHANKGVSQI